MRSAPPSRLPARLIEKAWERRLDQDVGGCRELVLRLAERAATLSAAEQVELILLRASLARAEGDLPRAEELCGEAEARLGERAAAQPRLDLQRGLNALVAGDFALALERFLRAREEAARRRRPSDEAWATINAWVASHELGLDAPALRESLRALGDGLPRGVRETRTMLEASAAFRAGRLDAAFAEPGPVPTQLAYFRLWLAEHPLCAPATPRAWDLAANRAEWVARSAAAHAGGVRARTIAGVTSGEDRRRLTARELCDRLSLWTTRWLLEPERAPFPLFAGWTELAERLLRPGSIGAEDLALARHALAWLALVSGRDLESVDRWARARRPGARPPLPRLELEGELLAAWFDVRDGRRASARLRLGPASARAAATLEPGDRIAALLAASTRWLDGGDADETGERAWLAPWRRILAGLGAPAGTSAGDRDLVVRPERGETEFTEAGGARRCVRSESLARALARLAESESVAAEELARAAFGLRRYDPWIHETKLLNLLNRARKALATASPEIRIGLKEGRVWRRPAGPPPGVRVEREGALARAIREDGQLGALLDRPLGEAPPARPERDLRATLARLRADGHATFRRRDFQRWTGMSRPTALRALNECRDRGWLQATGSARATVYEVTRT